MTIQIQSKTKLLLVVTLLSLALAIFDDYQGWRFLFLGLAAIWLTCRFWAQSLARGLALNREMRYGWAQVGDRLEERFVLRNKSPLPAAWIEVIDHSNLPQYSASIVTGLAGNSSHSWHTNGVCNQRGLFTLGPTSLVTSDPLGFYRIELLDSHSVTLMITPPIVPLPEIRVAPGGKAGEGRPRPNAPERTVSAAGVREYMPGDSLRWVHWRTSAHRDELYVRLFENTPSGDWWIILDLDETVQAGQGEQSTEEHGIILAASLADRGLRMGRSVGLIAHGHPPVWLRPRQGDHQRWEILRSLAPIQAAANPLSTLLRRAAPALGWQSSLVIITPNTEGSWLEGLIPLLWQGILPTVLVFNPQSFSGLDNSRVPNNTSELMAELARWGVQRYLITPNLLNRPEAHPGRRGRLEWRVTPSGRAILANPPRDVSWRPLS
jgi:uncharacterized protein (DUF58 family)